MSDTQGFPQITSPFVDDQRNITRAWRQFLVSIWKRSGGAAGGVVNVETGASVGALVKLSGPALIASTDLSGDVTTAGGEITTIGANKVTNGKFRQSGPLSLVGRSANSNGNIADISATANSNQIMRERASALVWGSLSVLLDDVFGNTRGAILERGAATWGLLAPGTNGFVLTSNGAGADPAYKATTASFISSSAPLTATQALVGAAAYADLAGCVLALGPGTFIVTGQIGYSATVVGNIFGKLYNFTDTVDYAAQESSQIIGSAGSMIVQSIITLAAAKSIRLAARASSTYSVVKFADTASASTAVSTTLQAVQIA